MEVAREDCWAKVAFDKKRRRVHGRVATFYSLTTSHINTEQVARLTVNSPYFSLALSWCTICCYYYPAGYAYSWSPGWYKKPFGFLFVLPWVGIRKICLKLVSTQELQSNHIVCWGLTLLYSMSLSLYGGRSLCRTPRKDCGTLGSNRVV